MQKLIFLSNIFPPTPNHPIYSQNNYFQTSKRIISLWRSRFSGWHIWHQIVLALHSSHAFKLIPSFHSDCGMWTQRNAALIQPGGRVCHQDNLMDNHIALWCVEVADYFKKKLFEVDLVADEGKKGQRRNSNFFF